MSQNQKKISLQIHIWKIEKSSVTIFSIKKERKLKLMKFAVCVLSLGYTRLAGITLYDSVTRDFTETTPRVHDKYGYGVELIVRYILDSDLLEFKSEKSKINNINLEFNKVLDKVNKTLSNKEKA